MRVALNDLDGAIRYIANSQNEHPNRVDICKSALSRPPPNSQPNRFLNSNNTASSPQPNPFGGSSSSAPFNAFGTQSQPGVTSAFGQPASLGMKPSPFGQPSQLGQTASPFGQPSQLGQKASPFGQPSQLGHGPSPFGQPASLNSQQSNPFAQNKTTSSPFAVAANNSAFGSTAQPTGLNVFGQPLQPPGGNIFSQSGTQPAANAFGASSTTNASSFAAQDASTGNTITPNPFGQSPAQTAKPGAFGSTQAFNPPSAFGNAGQRDLNGTSAANDRGFGTDGSNPNPFPVDVLNPNGPESSHSHPDIRTYSIRDVGNKLISWKSKPVSYVENEPYFRKEDGSLERIWFPNGPPIYSAATEPPIDEIHPTDLDGHKFLLEHGTFKDGIMPNVAPQREYCRWDF